MKFSHSDARPLLAGTISPLMSAGACAGTRAALEWMSAAGYRGVQISATDPETRPRDLSTSARRDLAATLVRHELACSGIDLFIPAAHFTDPSHVARAFDATTAAIEFAAVLGRAPVTVPLPLDEAGEVRSALAAVAARNGVDVLVPIATSTELASLAAPLAASIDCAAVLAAGGDPSALVLAAQAQLGGVRLVDLGRSGLRTPILEPRESRLDALSLRVTLESAGFTRLPVVDARQWSDPARGLSLVLDRWSALVAL